MKRFFSKSLTIIGFLGMFCLTLLITTTVQGADIIKFNPQIPMPGVENNQAVGKEVGGVIQSDLLSKYIAAIYEYGLAVAGIIAAIVLMFAGVLWLTSGGNPSKVGQAKDLIVGSLTGVTILFGAWLLLNTINPELLKLRPISITNVVIEYCCDPKKGNILMEKDSSCDSGSICSGTETCKNRGGNKFTCAIDEGIRCCEYQSNDGKFLCDSIQNTSDCPPAPSGYTFKNNYNNYFCGDGVRGEGIGCKLGSCASKADGDTCEGSAGFCYNRTCWTGQGQVDEPCGNESGARCFEGLCKDPYHQDLFYQLYMAWYIIPMGYVDGRQCGSGLSCCY